MSIVRFSFRCFALLVALAFAGGSASAATPYDITCILSLTGAGAFVGTGHQTTLLAAESYINRTGGIGGRPVHFVIEDDRSDPVTAVQLFGAVVAGGAPVVIGPTISSTCYAVLPLVKTQIVQYCLAPSIHPLPGSYSFSGGVSTKDLAAAGVRYLRLRGATRLAVLDTTDATGQDGDNVLREDLALPENKGVTVVDFEHFNPSDVTVAAQIARIRASGAQAVYAWVTGTPFATVLHGVYDGGLDIPILTNAGNISNAQIAQYQSFLPNQLYFTGLRFLGHSVAPPGPVRNAQNIFYAAMSASHVRIDELSATAWDPTLIVTDALRHVGTNASAKAIHDYIEQLHGFASINGIIDFRDGGQRGLTGNAALNVRYDKATKTWVPVSRPGGAPL